MLLRMECTVFCHCASILGLELSPSSFASAFPRSCFACFGLLCHLRGFLEPFFLMTKMLFGNLCTTECNHLWPLSAGLIWLPWWLDIWKCSLLGQPAPDWNEHFAVSLLNFLLSLASQSPVHSPLREGASKHVRFSILFNEFKTRCSM